MNNDLTFFADTIISARLSNGVVRILMGTQTEPPPGTQIEQGKVAIKPAFEMALPLSGVVDLTNAMQKLLLDMKQKMELQQANLASGATAVQPPTAS